MTILRDAIILGLLGTAAHAVGVGMVLLLTTRTHDPATIALGIVAYLGMTAILDIRREYQRIRREWDKVLGRSDKDGHTTYEGNKREE